ncbi:MAG: hypothetical protein EOP06_16560, partial [Proteobacteria bacterium]
MGEGNGDKYEGECGEEVDNGDVVKLGIETGVKVNSDEHVAFFDNLVWLNSEEAARYLRRSVGQLRNMVHRRQLAYKK